MFWFLQWKIFFRSEFKFRGIYNSVLIRRLVMRFNNHLWNQWNVFQFMTLLIILDFFNFSSGDLPKKSNPMMALLLRSFSLQSKQSLNFIRQISTFKPRFYSKDGGGRTVAKSEGRKDVGEAKPIGEKIKETAKTTSYLGVILLGVGVTAVMFYAIFNELFSSNSPQAIYGKAFEKCKEDPRVQDSLGQPIKCYGEESRRRRRNHVAHQLYQKNNRNYMRLSFHIQGIRNKATVHCEMREVSFTCCTPCQASYFSSIFRTILESLSIATCLCNLILTLTQRSSLKITDWAIQSTMNLQVTTNLQHQFSHKSLPVVHK